MKTNSVCDRVRQQLTASRDGEATPAASDQAHLAGCPGCRTWLAELESVAVRLDGLTYATGRPDLWAGVERSIRERGGHSMAGLLVIPALLLAWRALQLLVDVPLPILHPIVPLAAGLLAVWSLAGDPLAIDAVAPDLRSEASHGRA